MNLKKTGHPFLLYFLFLLFLVPDVLQAQPQQADTLKVGVAGSVPFVVDAHQDTGISLEIWQAVAEMEGFAYKLIYYSDVPNALTALEKRELDVVVGPVSITPERATRLKFTQPYYQSSISIMSRSLAPSFWQRIEPFFSIHFFYAVLVFLFILAIVGILLWVAERNDNPEEFPRAPASGIANGMWCAIVTMSTTGYGDRSPRTLWGRIIAGCWMVTSIVFATTLVAGIASSLSLTAANTKTIAKAEQLDQKKVAVVKNSPSDAFVEPYGAQKIYVESLEAAYDSLKAHKVDAVVYDRPQMFYFLKNHRSDDITISPHQYMRQGYGFAVPLNSKSLHELDIELLKLQASGRVTRIVNEWLGKNEQ